MISNEITTPLTVGPHSLFWQNMCTERRKTYWLYFKYYKCLIKYRYFSSYKCGGNPTLLGIINILISNIKKLSLHETWALLHFSLNFLFLLSVRNLELNEGTEKFFRHLRHNIAYLYRHGNHLPNWCKGMLWPRITGSSLV